MDAAAVITIEPTANDDAPPCLSLECPCGKRTHQCSMYGPAERYPGVRCEACGRLWRLDVRARGILVEDS